MQSNRHKQIHHKFKTFQGYFFTSRTFNVLNCEFKNFPRIASPRADPVFSKRAFFIFQVPLYTRDHKYNIE